MRELIPGLQPNERFLELQEEAIKGLRMHFFPFPFPFPSVVYWGRCTQILNA